jgi:hypothetical protein
MMKLTGVVRKGRGSGHVVSGVIRSGNIGIERPD